MIGSNGYVNDNKLMSFIARIALHDTDRGLGKSYGERKRLLKRYLRFLHRFVCLYRTKADRDAALSTWLEQFINPPEKETFGPFDKTDFKWRKHKYSTELYYQDDENPIGYFLCVTHVNAIKQMYFPDTIRWGWFDEYIPEAYTKLPGIENEGLAILKIMDTIEHDTLNRQLINGYPRVRWVFYGNVSNIHSPLLQFFGVDPNRYGVYRGKLNGEISKDVIIERELPVISKKFGDFSNAARIYNINENEYEFVCNKPLKSELLLSLRIKNDNENHFYHIYKGNGVYWINEASKHKGDIRRGTILGKRSDEITLMDNGGLNNWKQRYIRLYSVGYVYFSNVYTKLKFLSDII